MSDWTNLNYYIQPYSYETIFADRTNRNNTDDTIFHDLYDLPDEYNWDNIINKIDMFTMAAVKHNNTVGTLFITPPVVEVTYYFTFFNT